MAGFKFLGFEIRRSDGQPETPKPMTELDDGAVVVTTSAEGGSYGTYVDMEGAVRSEADLIGRYRDMVLYPEVDMAIDDIINEVIVYDPNEKMLELDMDELPLDPQIKEIIAQEFDQILDMIDYRNYAYEIFKRWYVDGRLYFKLNVNPEAPQNGITDITYIDPRKIRKIREKIKKSDGSVLNAQVDGAQDNLLDDVDIREYFIYNDAGFGTPGNTNTNAYTPVKGARLTADSVVYVPSGVVDKNNKMVLSYLHKAIKPLNQLRMLEDSTVIYRIARAPERRVWYLDVGNLPKMKAEQYIREMMTRHKNRLVYDANTGELRDDRKFMTMLEDYWLPRRGETGRGTEIDTLPGGQNLGEINDVKYFQEKLYKSLNVPITRLIPESGFNLGRSAEITRDEVKFQKFIDRLRLKFSRLFTDIIGKQLILKQIILAEEWDIIKTKLKYKFSQDNYFSELKNQEIIAQRVETLSMLAPYIGTYFSRNYVYKKVLQMTDEDVQEMQQEILQELQIYGPPPPEMMP